MNDPDAPAADAGGSGGSGGSDAAGGSSSVGGSSGSGGSDASGGSSSGGSGGSDASGGSSGSGGSDSSGGSSGSGGSGGTTSTVQVVADIQADPDLIGFRTSLDGSDSSTTGDDSLVYEWEILSVPNNSDITTDSLSATDAPQVDFMPDLSGPYEVQLTVTGDGEEDVTTLVVNVPAIDIGYLQVAGDEASYTKAGGMVLSDGTNAHNVGCFFAQTASSESSWLSSFRDEGQFSVRVSYPTNIMSPTTLGYAYTDEDSGDAFLQIAGPDNDCDNDPPVTTPGYPAFVFSPSGHRVAYFAPNEDGSRALTTVAADGTDARVIRADAFDPGFLASPYWQDDTHVLWADYAEDTESGDQWTVIYRAEDQDGAFTNDLLRDVLMDCQNASDPLEGISQLAFHDNVLYMGEIENTGFLQYTYNLWRMTMESGLLDCERGSDLNDLLVADVAHDFALSPDGSRLMYYAESPPGEGEEDTTIIAEGASDGSTGFQALVRPNGGTNTGAHWVAGGRQVVWTRTVFQSARPVDSEVWIINADGKNPRLLHSVSSSAAQARMLHTGGNGCSLSKGQDGSHGWYWVSVLGLLAFGGWRRRRSNASSPTSAGRAGSESRGRSC